MITLLKFIISFLLISSATNAQTSKSEFTISNTESFLNTESKAVKNFRRSHPNIMNETWRSDNGYYFVSFMQGNTKNKIAYTRDGKVDYSLKMYHENNLPYAVRNSIKSIYYDYKITDVQELKVKNKTIYLVKITDTHTWRMIRFCNGDLEEIENYSTVISPCR